jgi:hypothetical protein
MVFSKGMYGYDPESQSKILNAAATLVDAGRSVRSRRPIFAASRRTG